jgi:OmpA-OmpF porin, OOP family
MKKLTFAFIAFIAFPVLGSAQSGLLQKMKNKVQQRAEQRADEGMEKGLDEAEAKAKKKGKSEEAKDEAKAKEKNATDNETAKVANPSLQVYSRYDFIPGERIVYAEDFSQDAIGEFPLKWATNNRGETVTIESLASNWMRLFPASNFASPAIKKLPENFTIEMDILMQFIGEGGYMYPEIKFKFFELPASDVKARSYVMNRDAANEVAVTMLPGGAGQPLSVELESFENGSTYFTNQKKEIKTLSDNNGKPFHLSIWVQKERIRYWVNGDKISDIPQAAPAGAAFNRVGFSVESTIYTEEQLGIYVSNIKIAEGTPDMRSKLITEGKLVTHGILFDVASDKIKPESSGVLKEIATVLKENPSVKVKVIGHTDSDGEEVKNLDLSRRRSAAVKAALAKEFDIDASRMETDGMGESKPVADNTTKEGKAQNRRVEFIKL